jgi:hypothetical protein
MGREIMIVKKRNKKHSTEHTLIQGDRYFKFEEYFEDYINTFYNKKETKPMLVKKVILVFNIYYLKNNG